LTASVGEGHDAPARTLSAQLREESPAVEILVEDGLSFMGRSVRTISETAPRIVFFRGEWLWDAGYAVFAKFGPTRRLSQKALELTGARGLLRLVESRRPDVIVSLYPQTTEVLGRARASGRLGVPICAGVTDVAALWYWATPGADVHLVTHPESIAEVRRIAGPRADVRCVHGFTDPAFLEPRSREHARASLALPSGDTIVVVSGGGWGVGKVGEAIDVALGLAGTTFVVCLCGRNERLRTALLTRYAAEPRARIEGFTDRMPEWLAAADVLVHSTGGLTILEAQMSDCPAISYGWSHGHVRVHNEAFRRFGLARVADTDAELSAALHDALRRPRVSRFDFSSLPSAASVVLELADRAGSRADPRERVLPRG
jgi:processive 1,2-diacylglycerol beta-glucosyltransferase